MKFVGADGRRGVTWEHTEPTSSRDCGNPRPAGRMVLAEWYGRQAGNYSTAPKNDVTFIEGYWCAHDDCEEPELAYIQPGWIAAREGEQETYRRGGWVHVEAGRFDHQAEVEAKCRFCGAGPEHLHSSQHAWHDQTECTRCGGVAGYAIGD